MNSDSFSYLQIMRRGASRRGREPRPCASVSFILWRCVMKSLALLPGALCFAAYAISGQPASAQSRATPIGEVSADAAASAGSSPDATAAPGPVIFVIDSARHLATVNVGDFAVRRICRTGRQLTDIAFNPNNRKLYGISFNALYQVSASDCSTRFIANLGVDDAN